MPTKALNDLPLDKLISEPLNAAANAHVALSKANLAILKELSVENNTFEFTTKDPQNNEKKITVSVPTLAVVDLPCFSIDRLTNEFTFEVSTIQDSMEEKEGSLKGSASAGGFISKFVDFNLEAGYNKTNRTTSSNSERGKLNISVTATRTGYSKGMQTILDAAVKAITTVET